MRKELYGIFIAVLIALSAVNVDVANKSNRTFKAKNVITKIAKSLNLRNGEAPKKIVYTYDAAGNRIKREAVTAKSSQSQNDSTKVASSETDNSVSGSSMTKSAIVGSGNTEVGVAEFTEFENKSMIVTIYPNPTQGLLQVDITGIDIPQGAQIEIFAANGSLNGRWTDISPNNSYDISDKPAGIYILRLSLGKDCINSWKIIKN